MRKNKIKSGNIFQIELPKNLGFAYAKLIDLQELGLSENFPILLRVYNCRSEFPITDVKLIPKSDLILSPLTVAGILSALKGEIWQLVGFDAVNEDDKDIPDYKLVEMKFDEEQWFHISNLNRRLKIKNLKNNVIHLENYGAIGSQLVPSKIAISFLVDEGQDVGRLFDLGEYHLREFYEDACRIPPYYRQPISMRGRAIRSPYFT